MASSFALLLSGGLASADRFHGGGARVERGHGRVDEGGRGGWRGGERGEWRGGGERGEWRGGGEWRGREGGVSVRGYAGPRYEGRYEGPRYEGRRYEGRSWIYARQPIIREHYYDRWHRPEVIVEDYGPMDGYVWVAGSWQWNGVEWLWYPGHYEPAY